MTAHFPVNGSTKQEDPLSDIYDGGDALACRAGRVVPPGWFRRHLIDLSEQEGPIDGAGDDKPTCRILRALGDFDVAYRNHPSSTQDTARVNPVR